jgi:adenosyl cobinamide kinase/adenosyl cobinamide phosphate guanylyltransferase
LAKKLTAINLDSNFYRADRRVLVIDSLSGWLRGVYHRMDGDAPEEEERIDSAWREALEAILAFQGRMIVVTEELSAGLFMSAREQGFAYKLAYANRVLMEASEIVYRMTAGMAAELKGYRLKRGKTADENIYPDR